MAKITYRNAISTKEKLDRLKDLGVLSEDQVITCMTEYKKSNQPIEKIIVYLGFVTESALTSLIANDLGIEKISLINTVLDNQLVQQLPRNVAEKFCVIPLSMEDNVLTLCMSDSNDIRAKDAVKKYFHNAKIQEILSPRSEIFEAINKYYDYEMSPENILRELEKEDIDKLNHTHFVSPVVRFCDAIILDALKKKASDIHFEPEKFFIRVRYRIDGILTQLCVFHKSYWNKICVRIKIMSSIDIADTIRPHSGRFTMNLLGRDVDFRVSSHPVSNGENIVIRILDKTNFLIPLSDLGYSDNNISILQHVLQKKDGLIIITGPTGSGKTTSLYAILSMIQSKSVNVMTLEDPIEYELPLIRQSSILDIGGRSFADGLRSILRQDPDIIFIGEVRDATTAEMAVRSAMTGHQVFTTLHTQDSFGAIFRLMDLGISPFLLAGNVSAIMAQRLVRKLCEKCKSKKHANDRELMLLKYDKYDFNDSFGVNIPHAAEESSEYMVDVMCPKKYVQIFKPNGCSTCHYTGYHGRTTISEVLQFNNKLNEAIYFKKSLSELMAIAKANNFVSMREDARNLVLQGLTTLDEVSRVIDLLDD